MSAVAALTELFESVKNEDTPVMVERIVADIDDLVRSARFDGWQDTAQGDREVHQALHRSLSVGYKMRGPLVFERAHEHIRLAWYGECADPDQWPAQNLSSSSA